MGSVHRPRAAKRGALRNHVAGDVQKGGMYSLRIRRFPLVALRGGLHLHRKDTANRCVRQRQRRVEC